MKRSAVLKTTATIIGSAIAVNFLAGIYEGANAKNGTAPQGLDSLITNIRYPLTIMGYASSGILSPEIGKRISPTTNKLEEFIDVGIGAIVTFSICYTARAAGYALGHTHG